MMIGVTLKINNYCNIIVRLFLWEFEESSGELSSLEARQNQPFGERVSGE